VVLLKVFLVCRQKSRYNESAYRGGKQKNESAHNGRGLRNESAHNGLEAMKWF